MSGAGPEGASDVEIARLQGQVDDLLDVIYRVSHDLQAPLRRVGAFSELLQQRAELEPRSMTWLGQVVTDAQLAQRRLGAVLTYSRIGRDWAPAACGVSALIAEAIEATVALDERAVDVCAPIASLRVDKATLTAAVSAVLANAARFAEQTIEVSARIDDDGRFSISVFNDGPVIGERQRQRVTQLFNSTEPASRAGVGLAMAQRVMRLHGGAVCIGDRDGHGCDVVLHGWQQPAPSTV